MDGGASCVLRGHSSVATSANAAGLVSTQGCGVAPSLSQAPLLLSFCTGSTLLQHKAPPHLAHACVFLCFKTRVSTLLCCRCRAVMRPALPCPPLSAAGPQCWWGRIYAGTGFLADTKAAAHPALCVNVLHTPVFTSQWDCTMRRGANIQQVSDVRCQDAITGAQDYNCR